MKLSLAATLLGQIVPTMSKGYGPIMARDGALRLTTKILGETSPQLILDHDNRRQGVGPHNRRLKRQVTRKLKNAPSSSKAMMVPCDPRSTDADVGILSCGQDSTCEPSVKSSPGGTGTPLQSSEQNRERRLDSTILSGKKGPLVNQRRSVTRTGGKIVQRDPTSIDVGILVCREGQFCKHDEASGLGGYCVDTTTSNSRRLTLYYLEDYLFLCAPPSPEYPMACDCSGVNNSAGAGTMYCTHNYTATWVQGCDEYVVYGSSSLSFNNSVMVKGRGCYETTTPFIETICFIYYVDGTETACYAEWNGQRCASCSLPIYDMPAFDCSNVDGGRVGDSRKELLSVFDLCSNTTCSNFCGEGSFIPDYNFAINASVMGYNYTCGLLAYIEEDPSFFDKYCPYIIEAAQTSCCVPLPINSTIPPGTDNSTSSGGGASTPGPKPEEGTDEVGDSSTVPDGSILNFALVACEAAVVMALVAGIE